MSQGMNTRIKVIADQPAAATVAAVREWTRAVAIVKITKAWKMRTIMGIVYFATAKVPAL